MIVAFGPTSFLVEIVDLYLVVQFILIYKNDQISKYYELIAIVNFC